MILGNLLLALVWAALNEKFTFENMVAGFIIGHVVLMILAKGGVLPKKEVGRVERAISLFGYLSWQIVLANFKLTMDAIRKEHRFVPGIIRVPLSITDDADILLLAAMINITPGSVALDVSKDKRVLYVHVMNMENPDAARWEIKDGFERRILELRGDNKEESHAA